MSKWRASPSKWWRVPSATVLNSGPNLILAASLGLWCGCGQPVAKTGSWSDWQRDTNAYAQRFQLWHRDADRLLLVFGHGGEQDTVAACWLAYDTAGTPPPVHSVRFSRPLRSIAVGSTTHVPFIAALGKLGAVVACAHAQEVRDAAFADRQRSGKVKELASGDGIDREALVALAPDALLGYPFGRADGGTTAWLGVPVIEVSEYLEEHPLGRAEWIRFFGVLLGEERMADSLFAGIRTRYERLRAQPSAGARPVVLFGSVWSGQWWVPPGNSYMARLIEDAGGHYVFADRMGQGNIAVDMETMVTIGERADFWGMVLSSPGPVSTSAFTGSDERLLGFRSVRSDHLFAANSAESDFFGRAIIEPDILLRDLACCIRPDGCPDGEAVRAEPAYFSKVEPKGPAMQGQ